MKKLCAFLLSLSILLSLTPVRAQAEDFAMEQDTITAAPDPGLPDNDDLFAAYADQVFYGTSISTFGAAAGSRLSGDVKVLYDALVPIIRQIAEGKRNSTSISVGKTTRYNGVVYEPDVQATFTGKSLSGDDLSRLLTALMSDLPYEMYWYDKTGGCTSEAMYSGTLLYVTLNFSVSDNYRSGKYSTDVSKTASVALAAANAKRIVNCYASVSDYNKLMGYCDAICDLADYHYSAASQGDYSENNDPWQLIYVFDGDPSTKVVCEGYAKAFLYLCDLSDFSGDTVCYTVTGTLDGDTHMWNIVTLDNKNYLTDVTNSDSQDYGDALLLAGCRGSADSSYQVSRLTYRYDSATKSLWGTDSGSILTLAKAAYSPASVLNHTHSYGGWTQFTSASCSRIGIKSRVCSVCGYMDTHCSSTKDPDAPSLTVSVNTATGKPRLSWNTVSDADIYRVYRATGKSGTYTRIKSTSAASFTDSTATAGRNYYYKVIAVDTDTGKTSGSSNIVNRMCDLAKPSVSIGVSFSTGKPVVKWETVEGAAKYYIYRAAGANGTYTHVKTAVSARSFTDTTAVAGTNYYYKVKAIHEKESANSAFSAAVNRVCDLAAPTISVSLTADGTPRITWKTVDGAQKYYVYRSTSKNGTYQHVKTTVSARSFTDTAAEAGKTYYYKVQAIHSKSAANSAFSAIKSITAK